MIFAMLLEVELFHDICVCKQSSSEDFSGKVGFLDLVLRFRCAINISC